MLMARPISCLRQVGYARRDAEEGVRAVCDLRQLVARVLDDLR